MPEVVLLAGSHPESAEEFCAVEAAAWLAGESHSDHPAGRWAYVMTMRCSPGTDPVTGDVRSAKTALEFVRRDALKASGKAGSL